MKKILSVFKNGPKINVFQFNLGGERSQVIQSGHKLSNLVTNDQNHAKKVL